MAGNNLYARFMRMNGMIQPANAGDVADLVDTTTAVLSTQANLGAKIAGGTGSLVSGAATIATGLTTVLGFTAVPISASGTFATGASEVFTIYVTSITTGSVVVNGVFNQFTTGNATKSVSGTTAFSWFAYGT